LEFSSPQKGPPLIGSNSCTKTPFPFFVPRPGPPEMTQCPLFPDLSTFSPPQIEVLFMDKEGNLLTPKVLRSITVAPPKFFARRECQGPPPPHDRRFHPGESCAESPAPPPPKTTKGTNCGGLELDPPTDSFSFLFLIEAPVLAYVCLELLQDPPFAP